MFPKLQYPIHLLCVAFLSLAIFSGGCRNELTTALKENSDSVIDEVLGVNLERALARVGMNPAQIEAYLLNTDPGRNTCAQNYHPSIPQILEQRQRIGADPYLANRVCSKKGVFKLIGLCSVMSSLINFSPSAIKMKLEWDSVYWRAVHLLNLVFHLNHMGEDDQILYNTLFGIVDEIKSQKVDQIVASGQKVDTVFIGDSLMMLFEEYLKTLDHPEFTHAVFMGIGGERSDHFLYRMADHIFRLRPHTVVISTTGNDLLQKCPFGPIHDNRQKIAERLRLAGIPRVIWISLPPVINKADGTDATYAIVEENKDIQNLWKYGIEYMDAFSRLQTVGGLPQLGYYSAEGTHLTHLAYHDVWVPMLHAMGVN